MPKAIRYYVDNARNFTFEGVTAVKVVMVFWFVTP
jgi:hypothetical protein